MEKENIFRTYTLDYLGKYHFYEEDELKNKRKDGEYCLRALEKVKEYQEKLGSKSEGSL